MIEEKVKKVLQENVDPILSEHYGGSVLTKIEDDVAYVRLTGSCATCPAAQDTIKDVVRNAILGNVEGIRDVILDDSVSDELLDFAEKDPAGEEVGRLWILFFREEVFASF